MSDYRTSIVFALLITVLISIPAASQTVNISDESSYSGEIDSKFSDMFDLDFEAGKMLIDMIESDSKLEIRETFDRKVVSFQTPTGYIEKTETNDSITRVVQTPYGRLEWGVKEGDNFSEFEGGDKEKTLSIKNSLQEQLSEKMGEAMEKKQVVVSRILPKIDAEVETRNEIEHFNLTNRGENPVDMEGWKVVTDGGEGDSMALDHIIEPGEQLVYYSGDRDEVDGAEDAQYGTGLTIYSGDGQVTLYNENERVVDSLSY